MFTKICIAVSQADARNYCFMYTISVIKRREKCLRHWTTQRRRTRGKLMSFTFFPFPSHPFVPKKKNCYRSGRYLAPRPIHFWRWVNAIKLSHFFFKILRYILCMQIHLFCYEIQQSYRPQPPGTWQTIRPWQLKTRKMLDQCSGRWGQGAVGTLGIAEP